MKVHRSDQSGFTLVEIMIVLIILGILAAIVIPQFSSASQSARASNVQYELQIIRTQLQYYSNQHNYGYPSFAQMWTDMISRTNLDGTTTGTPTIGPFLQQAPINPFNNLTTLADGTATTTGSASIGWIYNSLTGSIFASVPSAQAVALGLTTNDVATY